MQDYLFTRTFSNWTGTFYRDENDTITVMYTSRKGDEYFGHFWKDGDRDCNGEVPVSITCQAARAVRYYRKRGIDGRNRDWETPGARIYRDEEQ